nr:hypothetical protein [Tanacetum cinerariifolium]
KSRIDDDSVLDVLSLDSRKSRIDDDSVLDVLSLDSRIDVISIVVDY